MSENTNSYKTIYVGIMLFLGVWVFGGEGGRGGSSGYLHQWLAEWAYHCELLDRPQGTTNQLNYSVIWICRMFTQGKLLCDNNSTHRHWPRESQMTLQQTTVNNLKIFCSYWLAVKQKNNLSCLSLVFFLL